MSDAKKVLEQYAKDSITNNPRSLQKEIGPSEVGTPCERKLAHKLAGTDTINPKAGGASLRSLAGTAMHAQLQEVFDAHPTRFLTETKVNVGLIGDTMLDGSTDLFDVEEGRVTDYKYVGKTTLEKAKAGLKRGEWWSDTYRTQIHCYGLGLELAGCEVKSVSLWVLLQGGDFSDSLWLEEPYDRRRAEAALERANLINDFVKANGKESIGLLQKAEDYCTYCPFYVKGTTDFANACEGKVPPQHSNARVESILKAKGTNAA